MDLTGKLEVIKAEDLSGVLVPFTYYAIDKKGKIHTVERAFGLKLLDFMQKVPLRQKLDVKVIRKVYPHVKTKNIKSVIWRGMVKLPSYFYIFNLSTLDTDLLVSLGFALLYKPRDKQSGDVLVYDQLFLENQLAFDESEWDDPLNQDAVIRLSIYFLLTDPDCFNAELVNVTLRNFETIKKSIFCNEKEIFERLKSLASDDMWLN